MDKKASQENITLSILFEKKGQPMDLNAFSKVIQSYHKILCGSYLAAGGKRSMTHVSKHEFRTKIVKFKNGSIVMELVLDYYPLLQAIAPHEVQHPIFSTMQQVFEFYRIKNKFKKENGKEPNIVVVDNTPRGESVIINNINGTVNISGNISNAVYNTKNACKSMAEAMPAGGITSIHSKCDTAKEDLLVTQDDIETLRLVSWRDKDEIQKCFPALSWFHLSLPVLRFWGFQVVGA